MAVTFKNMANKIDLHNIIDHLSKQVGKREVAAILFQYESMISGFNTRKSRIRAS